MSDSPANFDSPTVRGPKCEPAADRHRELDALTERPGSHAFFPCHAGVQCKLPCYFADYEMLEEVARGGMGIVFRARQLDLNRIVAVKMIIDGSFADQDDVQRFLVEAESAANLDHPGIVPIYEVGESEGRHFFSMAYVAGESLAECLARGPLEAKRAATMLAEVADAIQYAHSQGVIHRDLKPANVLLDEAGRSRLTDFGVAKQQFMDRGLTVQGSCLARPATCHQNKLAAIRNWSLLPRMSIR